MKKRLDIQSLLEKTQKADLVRFLKSCFAKNPSLADDFLIHFASTFELDESEFHLITDRIRRMIPGNASGMTHRQANLLHEHLKDLMAQARDCQSQQDFRQAFGIVYHLILLLDDHVPQIPAKFGFSKVLDDCYHLLDQIYTESPAPDLKASMKAFLKQFIREHQAIPFHTDYNPYRILLSWEDFGHSQGLSLVSILGEKSVALPGYRKLWLTQHVEILAALGMQSGLVELVRESGEDRFLYQLLHRNLAEKELEENLIHILKWQYDNSSVPEIRNLIYGILRNQEKGMEWKMELAIREYFSSGDLVILEDFLSRGNFCESQLVRHLEDYVERHPNAERFYLYAAFKLLNQVKMLKEQLLTEKNIFEILPFLSMVYPEYQKEMEEKLSILVENYLSSHFGRPAVNFINDILDEINQLGHYRLVDYLMKHIQLKFGHRKHFQKLMKEVVQ